MSKRPHTGEKERKVEELAMFDTLPPELILLLIHTMKIEQLLRFCMTSNKWHTFVLGVCDFADIHYNHYSRLFHAGSFRLWDTLWQHVFSEPQQYEDFNNDAFFFEMYENHFKQILCKSSWHESKEALEFNQIAMELHKIIHLNALYKRDFDHQCTKRLLNPNDAEEYFIQYVVKPIMHRMCSLYNTMNPSSDQLYIVYAGYDYCVHTRTPV